MRYHAAIPTPAHSDGRRPRAIRRILAALAVLIVAAAGLVLPEPPPAHAGLYNLFPADYDGFPKGHFYSDEALYVTMTSDIKGGYVCIVSATVTDPTRANCMSNVAWGEPHTYVGLGTLLGYPLAAPRLQPGRWKLLSVPELQTVETVPVVKNVVLEQMKVTRPASGTELSEEFVVEACDPCDESWARDELQTWKDTAKTIAPSAASTKVQKAFDVASKAYKVAAGMYTGAAGGLAGILLGGMAGAGVFTFEVAIPSTNDLAKQLYKDLAAKTQSMFAGIAADPPDFDYDDIAPPALEAVAQTGNPLLDRYFQALSDAAAYGDASRIANERYQGALSDGDHEAAYLQAQATADYTSELVGRLRLIRLWQGDVATFDLDYDGPALSPGEKHLGAEPYFFDSFADVDDVDAYWSDVLGGLADIAANGIGDEQGAQVDGLMGCVRSAPESAECAESDRLIAAAVAAAQDPDLMAYLQAMDPHQTIGTFLQDQKPLYDDIIAKVAEFGDWMAHNAADEYRQSGLGQPNRPPVSAFTASATTGAAPLAVTFTSQATDPDGDTLSLTWDFAGARTVYDEKSVTHTFTKPGTYWVSLVATDPDGLWHQAVKKIEVYPGGSGPGGENHAPTASFTPTTVDKVGPFDETFTATSTDMDGDSLTHTWYFGDGTSFTGDTVTKTFEPGFVMSILLVASDGKASSRASGEVTSRPSDGTGIGANQPPVAAFTADPDSGVSPLQVLFTSTSTDPDAGDTLTYQWDFGDGQADGNKQVVAHTYTQPGTYPVTLIVSDGQATATATQTVTVTSPAAPLAAGYTVGKSYDAAKAMNGARLLDTGVPSDSRYPIGSLLQSAGLWLTPAGAVGQYDIIVELAGHGRDLLDRVLLTTHTSDYSVKTFSIALTQGSNPFSGYSTVVDHGVLQRSTSPQEFVFSPQTATFLKLTVYDSYSSTYMRLDEVSVPTVGRDGGNVAVASGDKASIVSATSTYSLGYTAENILKLDDSYWSTAKGAVADQTIRVRLRGAGPHSIDTIRLRGSTSSAAVKEFEVWVSESGGDGTWTEVIHDGVLPRDAQLHDFAISPVNAGFVELRLKNNHGDANYLYLYELQVIAGGENVASRTEVGGAEVVAFSDQAVGNPASKAIAVGADGFWQTNDGHATDQYVTVKLRGDQPAMVDRVSLVSSAFQPKNVEIQTSMDGSVFATVARQQLQNVGAEQFVTFPPTDARFVRLVVKDGYHANYLRVNRFSVFANDRGGADNVPFIDTSTGAPTAWAWDFGDGTTSTERYPRHTFPGPGTYAITLDITDADGGTDAVTGSYTVPDDPGLRIHANSYTVDEGKNVPVTAMEGGLGISQWEWDFGFATSASRFPDASVKFPDDGTFTVRARGLTADGVWTPWHSQEFTVRNAAPSVSAGNNSKGNVMGDVMAPGVTVTDVAADTVTCTWNWGDGSSEDGIDDCSTASARIAHRFARPGVYTATLTANDGEGGIASSQVKFTISKRRTFLQLMDAIAVGPDLTVTARLNDADTGRAVAGHTLQISATDADPVEAVTGADGKVTVTIPGASGSEKVTATFAGSDVAEPATDLTRRTRAPKADIVFMVDESGSMGSVQSAVKKNLLYIARALATDLDYRLAVVGFANDSESDAFGHIHAPLADGLADYFSGANALVATGGVANGFEAIAVASGYRVEPNTADGGLVDTGAMSFRENAASCAVLVTDAPISEAAYSKPRATRAQAEAALATKGTTLFSLIANDQDTRDGYGSGSGLAGDTGGDSWWINDFVSDPSAVLAALITKCVTKASTPDLAVAIAGPETVVGNADFTATVTTTNASAIDTPYVTTSATLPSELTFVSATGGGTYDSSTHTVTWPAVAMLQAGDHVAYHLTAHRDTTGLAPGDHPSTITANVRYNGSLGAESNPTNNAAPYDITVHLTEPGPDPGTGSGDIAIGTDLDDAAAPEAGDSFTYPLIVRYSGTGTATNVVVLQQVPDRLEITDIAIPEGWRNGYDDGSGDAPLVGPHPDGTTPGNWIYLTAQSVGPEDAPEIEVTSQLRPLALPAVVDDSGALDATMPALAQVPGSTITFQACVTATRSDETDGDKPASDCADIAMPVKDIVATVTVRLAGGITYLIVSVAVTDVLKDLPITLTCSPGAVDGENGDVDLPEAVIVRGLVPGRNYVIPWPEATIGNDGAATGWPGWRPITAADRNDGGELLDPVTRQVLTGEQLAEMVRGERILDRTLPAAAWRAPSTVTFSVNPSIHFVVTYREVVPVPATPTDPTTDPTTGPTTGTAPPAGAPGSSDSSTAPGTDTPDPASPSTDVEVQGTSQSVTEEAGATTVISAGPLANTGVQGLAGLVLGGVLLVLSGLVLILRERRRARRHV